MQSLFLTSFSLSAPVVTKFLEGAKERTLVELHNACGYHLKAFAYSIAYLKKRHYIFEYDKHAAMFV
jgi:hypothetical protein